MDPTAATPGWAFATYCAVRHRLPPMEAPGRARRAETLAEIVAPFDAILFDAYGVLNVGEAPVPGAAERIGEFRRMGKQVAVVSNSAGYPKRVMMTRWARLGFDFTPAEVTSSREALIDHLAREPRRRWGAMMSPEHGFDEFEALDLTILGDDPASYDEAEGLLLIGSGGWTERRQVLLEAALGTQPRPVLVGNPDLVAPRETGLSLEPGYFAHRLADRTGVEPQFFGKPFGRIFELALSRLSPAPPPERVLMVGDTLHTDVLGGAAMGFATALMTDFGLLAGADAAPAITASGIAPDFVVARP